MVNLLDYRHDKYSALGNDGIIKYIFKRMSIKKGFFVEFGAWDGIYTSNCRKLFKSGWGGIFIECDKKKYKRLASNYKKYDHITCINSKIDYKGENTFDNVISPYLGKRCIDFCSIDVDGLDVEIFEKIDKNLPKVACIESGFILPPFHERVSIDIAKETIQQSLSVTNDVFEKKGYKIICAGINCFFVKKEYYNLFNVPDDLLTLYFNGLRSFIQYIPSIWRKLKKIDGFEEYKNDIALDIMNACNYNFDKDCSRTRKKWEAKRKNKIIDVINEIENRERNTV